MEITSLDQLKVMAKGDIIELPRFKEDMPFVVRVKRISLLGLMKKNVIPNTLLSAAEELFYGKKASKGVDLDQLTNVMYIMAENALVEPSMKDFESVGLELTDEQLVSLFNYTQKGLEGIKTFHTNSEDTVNTVNGQAIQTEAK